ncbi:thioesterase domain-containing protein [Acinetobacter pollinis]|uniref:Non-ribosomal peptide synthetase n=1 Tax=Acinetobacter pollinis TaxID=2605270 RepID=A0ABU6DVI6_9GAMM|nr:non-ribosomal peptide synthetase [Acinetobacter pollinis]MEB5477845.1 non-ribosomal peptide synthetase [Acinetobacter pollinis]
MKKENSLNHLTEIEVKNKLNNIWKNILATDSFDNDTSFFELGGDSILTIMLIENIDKELNYQFNITSITSNSSINKMAKLISSESILETSTNLIPLQTKGNKNPFFGIHPLFGLIYPYINLAKELGKERPFYAFQSKGYNKNETSPDNIESLAEGYITEMKKLQPVGPYSIGGWSFGAVVAYEMAQQLRNTGDIVENVILIDLATDSAEKFFQKVPKTVLIKRFLEIVYAALISYDPSFKKGNLFRNIIFRPKKTLLFISKILIPMTKIGYTNTQALKKYILKPYSGDITLIHTADPEFTSIDSIDLGWDTLVIGNLKAVKIEGAHLNLHTYPYVIDLAKELNATLDNTQV